MKPPSSTRPPLKHYHRLLAYDYSRGAVLFITITTSPRRQLFGRVSDAKMVLSPFGAQVAESLAFTFSRAPDFRLYGQIVMPDHVHFRVYLAPGHANAEAIPLINKTVGRFKSFTTHLYQTKYGGSGALWQEGFHDWVCETREMIDAVERYIAYNPLKWELRNNRRLLRLYEPILSPRLGFGEFWRGVGAIEAAGSLDWGRCLVSLRVSRRCLPRDVEALVARLLAKAGDIALMSGFISGGERAVFSALLGEPRARLVKVLPYAMGHDFQPSVALMPAISEGRLAIIARGNSPEELSRVACLDLNARIIDIADKAAYALPGEVKWLK